MSNAHRAWVVLLLGALAGGAPEAHAYIPPSGYVLQKISAKKLGYKTVRIRSTVAGLNGAPGFEKLTGVSFREVTWVDFTARVVRSRAYDVAGKEIFAQERKFDDHESPDGAVPLAFRMLIEPAPFHLARALKAASIPVLTEIDLQAFETEEDKRAQETAWLGRWDGGVSWVVGARGASQLWIQKDEFLPRRLLFEGADAPREVRYDRYRGFSKDFQYPRTILAIRGKEGSQVAILRDELTDVAVDGEYAELKAPLKAGLTEAGESSDSAVKDLLRQYYGILR